MVFRAWAHERVPLNLQWLVFRIGGTDFLHCWVTNFIWLECAKFLITISDSFNGGLFRVLVHSGAHSFVAYSLLLLGPTTHYRES